MHALIAKFRAEQLLSTLVVTWLYSLVGEKSGGVFFMAFIAGAMILQRVCEHELQQFLLRDDLLKMLNE